MILKIKFRRKLEFIYVWFKHVVLRIKIPLEAIELVEKHFNMTESEKKLIKKIKQINLKNQ
jgi:hypothetical protein